VTLLSMCQENQKTKTPGAYRLAILRAHVPATGRLQHLWALGMFIQNNSVPSGAVCFGSVLHCSTPLLPQHRCYDWCLHKTSCLYVVMTRRKHINTSQRQYTASTLGSLPNNKLPHACLSHPPPTP
jgi:hypothetical protein